MINKNIILKEDELKLSILEHLTGKSNIRDTVLMVVVKLIRGNY